MHGYCLKAFSRLQVNAFTLIHITLHSYVDCATLYLFGHDTACIHRNMKSIGDDACWLLLVTMHSMTSADSFPLRMVSVTGAHCSVLPCYCEG